MNIGLLGFGVVGRGVYDMLAGRDDIRAACVLCRRDLGELTARTTYEMQDILDDGRHRRGGHGRSAPGV